MNVSRDFCYFCTRPSKPHYSVCRYDDLWYLCIDGINQGHARPSAKEAFKTGK